MRINSGKSLLKSVKQIIQELCVPLINNETHLNTIEMNRPVLLPFPKTYTFTLTWNNSCPVNFHILFPSTHH
jgi:hypothetical protein